MKELIRTTRISVAEWVQYFKELYSKDKDKVSSETRIVQRISQVTNETKIMVTEEVEDEMLKLKSRKTPGLALIPNELIKYGRVELMAEITKLINRIFRDEQVLEE